MEAGVNKPQGGVNGVLGFPEVDKLYRIGIIFLYMQISSSSFKFYKRSPDPNSTL